MNGATTILVERLEHVAPALERKRRDPAGRLLALAPEVMAALDARGECYDTPEDFVPLASLKALGRINYELLEELGRWVETAFPVALVDPNPIWVHYYRLKLLVDSVGFRVYQLVAALHETSRVVAFVASGDSAWAHSETFDFITPDGPIYSALMREMAESLGIHSEIVATPPLAESSIVRSRSALIDTRDAVVHGLAALRAVLAPGGRRRRPAVRFGGLRHDMPALADAAARTRSVVPLDLWSTQAGRRLSRVLGARVSDARRRTDAERAWRVAEPGLARQPIFHSSGRDIYPFVGRAFRSVFTAGAVDRARRLRVSRRLVRHAPFALAIHSGRYDDALLAFACRAESVPVAYAQEGGLYGYCESPMHHYCELSLGTHFIAYGAGVSSYLNRTRLTDRQRTQCVSAGAFRLNRASTGGSPLAHGSVRKVLYVPTADFNHAVTYAPLTFSDREYYRLRRRVLEALLAIEEIEILYKSPAASTLEMDSCRDFIALHANRITPLYGPVIQACDRADLVVVDWPTTTLLEILTSTRPVVTLFSDAVMDSIPEALTLLRRRAWVSTTADEFIEHIERAVRGAAGPNPDDRSFLEAYGTGGPGAWSPADAQAFFDELCLGR